MPQKNAGAVQVEVSSVCRKFSGGHSLANRINVSVMAGPMVENDDTPNHGPILYNMDDRLRRREVVSIHKRKHKIFVG